MVARPAACGHARLSPGRERPDYSQLPAIRPMRVETPVAHPPLQRTLAATLTSDRAGRASAARPGRLGAGEAGGQLDAGRSSSHRVRSRPRGPAAGICMSPAPDSASRTACALSSPDDDEPDLAGRAAGPASSATPGSAAASGESCTADDRPLVVQRRPLGNSDATCPSGPTPSINTSNVGTSPWSSGRAAARSVVGVRRRRPVRVAAAVSARHRVHPRRVEPQVVEQGCAGLGLVALGVVRRAGTARRPTRTRPDSSRRRRAPATRRPPRGSCRRSCRRSAPVRTRPVDWMSTSGRDQPRADRLGELLRACGGRPRSGASAFLFAPRRDFFACAFAGAVLRAGLLRTLRRLLASPLTPAAALACLAGRELRVVPVALFAGRLRGAPPSWPRAPAPLVRDHAQRLDRLARRRRPGRGGAAPRPAARRCSRRFRATGRSGAFGMLNCASARPAARS